jgi:hypothetical protein
MFKFLSFFQPQPSPVPGTGKATGAPAKARQHSDMQQELVRVVLKDTLRQNGIPVAWLNCEIDPLPNRAAGSGLSVRLVVCKWDDRLVLFLPALQKKLVAGLDRFEPSVDHAAYALSWQFASDCGCPHTILPIPSSWVDPAADSAVKPSQPSVQMATKPKDFKPAFDLPPSAWDHPGGPETGPAPFAPTLPSHLV